MASVRSSEQEDVYVVCWDVEDEHRYDQWPKDIFKTKLHQPNIENWCNSGQTKWIYDDFGCAYGLQGAKASGILDWVRVAASARVCLREQIHALSHSLSHNSVCLCAHRSAG